jgi:hypothetical protein
MRSVLNGIHDLGLTDTKLLIAVWGVSMAEGEALRLLQAGVRGSVRKTADLDKDILNCLRRLASGRSWTEDCVFRDSAQEERYPGSELIPRNQLLEMNWQSSPVLQDPPEAYLSKDRRSRRYGLAVSGLKDRV